MNNTGGDVKSWSYISIRSGGKRGGGKLERGEDWGHREKRDLAE